MKNEVKGAFCGSVLLSEDKWDKDKLISDLQADWGIEIPKEDTEDEDTIVNFDKCRIVISKFPTPVPNEEAEINAENNWMWEEAVEVTKTHKAHIVVAILGDEEDLISRGLLYTKIMATCCKQEKAIGVFTSGVVFEPSYYMKAAEMIRDGELPIFTWVWFGLYRTENGLSTYTYGMKDFEKLELEILDADEDAGKLLSFISAIASYILQDDVKLKDRETIGLSEEDIHQITLSKGVALPEKTLKISYEKKKTLGGKDKEKFTMKTELIYNKENREEFFAKIEELIEKDKHTECINALESIPAEERDYEISYQLARALQNFALVGDDGKRTDYNIRYEFLLKSLEILESVRAEGQNKAEWNMRMAYGYQYLFRQEEKAIPYAQSWAELDPEDKNALEVIKECQEEIEKRENMEKINHEFFGELDLNGLDDGIGFSNGVVVLWEEEVNGINTTLWYDKSIKITTEMLDVFSNFLTNFDNNDEIARKALEAYLLEDSEYIDFHREDIELDLPEDVKEFVQCMKVTNIGFWADGENIIIVDYMISPEESDEILAVKFNSNFEIMDIAWES